MTNPVDDPLLEAAPVSEGFKILEPCVIYARIGAGGMGAVYRASHVNFNRDVAVKVLRPELAAAEDTMIKRFRKEAAMTAALVHQNLVQVFEVNYRHGLHYLVMEYIQGESLRDRVLRKGALKVGEACAIIRDAARGLALAHRKGIVHRDVKPDNILISRDGEVKVADLGLAKAVESDDNLTSTRMMMGTPQYTPPEQWEDARHAGPPADVWALGATLWFLLAGRSAIAKGTPMNVGFAIFNKPFPDLREVVPDAPDALYALIEKCTDRDPAARFEDAGALLEALESFIAEVLKGCPELADFEAGRAAALTAVSPPPQFTIEEVRSISSSTVPLTPEPEAPSPASARRAPTPEPVKAAPAAAASKAASPAASPAAPRSNLLLVALAVVVVVAAGFAVWQWLGGSGDEPEHRPPTGFDETAPELPEMESLLPRGVGSILRVSSPARAARLSAAAKPLVREDLWPRNLFADFDVPIAEGRSVAVAATFDERSPEITWIVPVVGAPAGRGDVRAVEGQWAAVASHENYVRDRDSTFATDLPAGDLSIRVDLAALFRAIRRELNRDLDEALTLLSSGSRNDPSPRPLVEPAIGLLRELTNDARTLDAAITLHDDAISARATATLAEGSAAVREPLLPAGRFDDLFVGLPSDHPVTIGWTGDPARVSAPIRAFMDEIVAKTRGGMQDPTEKLIQALKPLVLDHGSDAAWSAGAPRGVLEVVRVARHSRPATWIADLSSALGSTVPGLFGKSLGDRSFDHRSVEVIALDIGFDLEHMNGLDGGMSSPSAQTRNDEEVKGVFGAPAVPLRLFAIDDKTFVVLGGDQVARSVIDAVRDERSLTAARQDLIARAGSGPGLLLHAEIGTALGQFSRLVEDPSSRPRHGAGSTVTLFARQDARQLRAWMRLTLNAVKEIGRLSR